MKRQSLICFFGSLFDLLRNGKERTTFFTPAIDSRIEMRYDDLHIYHTKYI